MMKWFFFSIIALIFLWTPYERGLYFNYDFYSIALILLSLFIVLVVRIMVRNEWREIVPVFPLFIVPIFFLISMINAQNPQGAMDSFINWVAYVSFAAILFWSTFNHDSRKYLPLIFQSTAIWIAFHMLFNDYGFLTFPNAFIADRFAGVFQYPNTFGMLMIVFYLFSLMLLMNSKHSWYHSLLYAFPLVPFFVCFIESYSRGMYLVFPVTWLLGLLLLKTGKQISYLLITLVTVGFALLITKMMDMTIVQETPILALLIVLFLSGVASGLSLFLIIKIKAFSLFEKIRAFELKSYSRFVGPLFIVLIGLLGILDIDNKGLVYQQLPANLQERLSSVSGSNSSAVERSLFMQDAIAISKESPWIGHGGEAWVTMYKDYQQLPYHSNKIHNGYLEFLVDIGYIGVFFAIIVFGYLFFLVIFHYQKDTENTLPIAVIVSLLTIGAHSMIDFNMSFGSVWFIIICLLIMGIKPIPNIIMEQARIKRIAIITTSSLVLLTVFASVVTYQSIKAEQYYKSALDTSNLMEVEELMTKALNKNKRNIKYWYLMSDTKIRLAQNGINEEENKRYVIQATETLKSLEPKNSLVLYRAGIMLERIGHEEKALSFYEAALNVDKFDPLIYETAIKQYTKHAILYKEKGELEKAEHYATKSVEIYEKNRDSYELVIQNPIGPNHNSRELRVTIDSYEFAAIAYFLKEDLQGILSLLDNIDKKEKEKSKVVAIAILASENLEQADVTKSLTSEYSAQDDDIKNQINLIKEKYSLF
ncbi:O-antigen ligase family protein [Sutcliffiella horikoshii]|uniref:O-antigen ligase family protein n=1 Tax=Sutcliffiella horikoshii TaxID=79883 RepID=UPI00384FEDCD